MDKKPKVFDYLKEFKLTKKYLQLKREALIDDYFKFLIKKHNVKIFKKILNHYVHIGSEKELEEYCYWKNFLMQKIENKFFKKGLPSFCTSNMDVIDVIFKFCKLNNLPVLIEFTSNQVNQNGGYTGLKPQNFKKKINKTV